jgi:hypothetical protein
MPGRLGARSISIVGKVAGGAALALASSAARLAARIGWIALGGAGAGTMACSLSRNACSGSGGNLVYVCRGLRGPVWSGMALSVRCQ